MNKHNPPLLKALLVLQTLGVLAYTIYVGTNDGWNFAQIALSNIHSLGWNGQFTLDFSCYLVLSGCWIAWRQQFSLPAVVIASVAAVLGIVVFAPYVLYLLKQERGDLRKVLLGKHA